LRQAGSFVAALPAGWAVNFKLCALGATSKWGGGIGGRFVAIFSAAHVTHITRRDDQSADIMAL
jgi:hypothetical protein